MILESWHKSPHSRKRFDKKNLGNQSLNNHVLQLNLKIWLVIPNIEYSIQLFHYDYHIWLQQVLGFIGPKLKDRTMKIMFI